jgi:hypothetical protein
VCAVFSQKAVQTFDSARLAVTPAGSMDFQSALDRFQEKQGSAFRSLAVSRSITINPAAVFPDQQPYR